MTERLRFSPAPTGRLHVGGARTALFDWLLARSAGGRFVLRVEDTDPDRSARVFEATILEDLAWLGLDWDEGPDIDGPHRPYRQSERGPVYERTLRELRATGAVYPCFCAPERLAAERAEDEAAGRPPRYRGTCRAMPQDDVSSRLTAGDPAAWRFAVPPAREVAFDDRVHGRISFRTEDIGDFLVTRSDGAALYDLACVTDDLAMRITLVVRGDDHIANTPRQLLIYEALSAVPPRFAHLPLVVGPDGTPLSKSAGGDTIAELREQGFLPEAVIDYLARLGWSDPLGRRALTREELLGTFELARVSSAPPRHDEPRLRALDARHMRAMPPERLAAALLPYLPPLPSWLDPVAFAEAVRGDIEVASDAYPFAEGLVTPPPPDEEAAAYLSGAQGIDALRRAHEAVAVVEPFDGEQAYTQLRAAVSDADPRVALPAVRAALTGRAHGLPLAAVLGLLGRGRALERLGRTAEEASELLGD